MIRNGATAYRVSDDEQTTLDPPVQAIACLAVLPAPVNLDPPLRIAKGSNHEGECKSSLAQTLFAFAIVPFKFHTLSPYVVQ